MANEFLVELYGGTQWIAPWNGDPGRTCVRMNAKRYKSEHAAKCAISYIKRNFPCRDLSEAKIVTA
jgi:hypothetical protein